MRRTSVRARAIDLLAVVAAIGGATVAVTLGIVESPGRARTVVTTLVVGAVWAFALSACARETSWRTEAATVTVVTLVVFGLYALIATLVLPGIARPSLIIALPAGLVFLLVPRMLVGLRADRRAARAVVRDITATAPAEPHPSATKQAKP